MKLWPVVLLVALAVPPMAIPNPPSAGGHVQWVAASLKEMQQVKIGMRRSDLEKVFGAEGGVSQDLKQTYVYKGCPYFKVDVTFAPAESGDVNNEKIVRISPPYLAWTAGD